MECRQEKKSPASCFEVDILKIFQLEPLGFSCSRDTQNPAIKENPCPMFPTSSHPAGFSFSRLQWLACMCIFISVGWGDPKPAHWPVGLMANWGMRLTARDSSLSGPKSQGCWRKYVRERKWEEAAGNCAELWFAIHSDSEREAERTFILLSGGGVREASQGGWQISGEKNGITELGQVPCIHGLSNVGVMGEKKKNQMAVGLMSAWRQTRQQALSCVTSSWAQSRASTLNPFFGFSILFALSPCCQESPNTTWTD